VIKLEFISQKSEIAEFSRLTFMFKGRVLDNQRTLK